MTAVSASTIGYWVEIGSRHVRQRPPSSEPADDRDVLVPRELAAAARRRPRPARRSTARAAAGRCRRSGSCRSPRRTGAAATTQDHGRQVRVMSGGRISALRLGRQREERRGSRQRDTARAGRCSYGVPRRIDRDAAQGAGADERRPVGRRRAASRRRAGPTRAWSASMSSSASSCSRRRSASRAASRSRPTARIDSHMMPDDRRSPPSASVVAASERSHHGAPGDLAGACRTSRPPPDSRGATSSARTRCPACTPIYRVDPVIPFPGARWPDRAARRPRATARREKSRQTGKRC